MTEEELIKLCIQGNRKGQELLFQRFVSSMSRLCIRYLLYEDAREALMEGFLKVFSNLEKFEYQGKESLEVWIRKIMVNECLMKLRKTRHSFVELQEHDSLEEDSIDADFSAEEIFSIITSLPDGYRTIFNLFVIEGYNHKEIAAMLGISESASRSQLTHAREKLKKTFTNERLEWKILYTIKTSGIN